jgi:enoyl-CoA hydratase/carnithine racemase
VSCVVPDDRLMETALDIAKKIRKTNKAALLKIKETINTGLTLSLADGMKLEAKEFEKWREVIDPDASRQALKEVAKEKKE